MTGTNFELRYLMNSKRLHNVAEGDHIYGVPTQVEQLHAGKISNNQNKYVWCSHCSWIVICRCFEGKQQERREKPKDVNTPPAIQRMKIKTTKTSLQKDLTHQEKNKKAKMKKSMRSQHIWEASWLVTSPWPTSAWTRTSDISNWALLSLLSFFLSCFLLLFFCCLFLALVTKLLFCGSYIINCEGKIRLKFGAEDKLYFWVTIC